MEKLFVDTLPEFPHEECVYVLVPQRNEHSLYHDRTDRNIGWITKEEQALLRMKVVGIAGCGGMGGLVAATLVRLGIGEIRIADTEVFDISNLNRQFGCTRSSIGISKAYATARSLREIADDTTIVVYGKGIIEETVTDFIKGCDLICDEVEFFAIASRILIHKIARQLCVTILNSPTVGHRVYIFKFTPVSMQIEDVLGLDYEAACNLQSKMQDGTATLVEKELIIERMLAFAAPEIPEYATNLLIYSTVVALSDRLRNEGRASIIATNPPMASGFLANHILFHLLQSSAIKRNFIIIPPMPGYVMFDAGLHICKKVTAAWWNQQKQHP